MIILAINTSSPQGIVALQMPTGEIKSLYNTEQLEHNRFILNAVDSLLDANNLKLKDIDYLSAAVGPGSFVGTRLAVAVTQGLAFGISKPVVPISHLACIAEACFVHLGVKEITVTLDARMQGFYQGHFQKGIGLIGEESFHRFTDSAPLFTEIPIIQGEYLISLSQKAIQEGKALNNPALLQPVYLQDEGNWQKRSS